jgi:hypothetical protein
MCREIVRAGGHEAAARAVRKHANVRQLFSGGCDIFGQLERSGESPALPKPPSFSRRHDVDQATRPSAPRAPRHARSLHDELRAGSNATTLWFD